MLKSLGIDLAALKSHTAMQSSHSAGRRAHARINDQAARRDQGFEIVNGFVQPLLPVVAVLAHPVALVDIPDCLWEATGPLPKDQERLPGIDSRLW